MLLDFYEAQGSMRCSRQGLHAQSKCFDGALVWRPWKRHIHFQLLWKCSAELQPLQGSMLVPQLLLPALVITATKKVRPAPPSRRKARSTGAAQKSQKHHKRCGGVDVMEISVKTDQPNAVIELLLGFGASSASSMEAVTESATSAIVIAHFEGPPAALANLDLAHMGSIIQVALDLPSAPVLASRLLGGAWSEYFPLSESIEVRLPCHDGPGGGMLSEAGRRVLRLEGGVAFGAGRMY